MLSGLGWAQALAARGNEDGRLDAGPESCSSDALLRALSQQRQGRLTAADVPSLYRRLLPAGEVPGAPNGGGDLLEVV